MIQRNSHSNDIEVDQQRQQFIKGMVVEQGAKWMDNYKPGTVGCHELLDRTALIADLVEQHLLGHPACAQDADWFGLAQQAATLLHELYQRIGVEHFSDESPAAT